MNIEEIKNYYGTDEWFDNVVSEIAQYVDKIPADHIAESERLDLENEAKIIVKKLNQFKKTKIYNNFKTEQLEFIINLYNVLNNNSFKDPLLLELKSFVNDSDNIGKIPSSLIDFNAFDAYKYDTEEFMVSEEFKTFVRGLDVNIKQEDFSMDEIIKYGSYSNLPKSELSNLENTYLEFDMKLNEINSVSSFNDILYKLKLTRMVDVQYDYGCNNGRVEAVFANVSNESNLMGQMSYIFEKMSKKNLEDFIENLYEEGFMDNIGNFVMANKKNAQILLKGWSKKLFSEQNIKDKKICFGTLFKYDMLNKHEYAEIVYSRLYEVYKTGNNNIKHEIDLLFKENDIFISKRITKKDFEEFIKNEVTEEKITNNQSLFKSKKINNIKVFSLDRDELENVFGGNVWTAIDLFNTENFSINQRDTVLKIQITHDNISKINDDKIHLFIEKIFIDYTRLVKEMIVDDKKRKEVSEVENNKEEVMNSRLNRFVIEELIEEYGEVSNKLPRSKNKI